MTGYGRYEETLNGRTIAIELKSVNHRYFDFSVRSPRSCNFAEDKLKALTQEYVSRGKIEMSVSIQDSNNQEALMLNETLAKNYIKMAKRLAKENKIKFSLTAIDVMKMPDVVTIQKTEIDEDEFWKDIKKVAEQAIKKFVEMREIEGQKLKKDLLEKLDNIEKLTCEVEKKSPETLEKYRERLYQKVKEVLEDKAIDESRILTECAIFADKIAVDEETVRLHSHIEQFRSILNNDEPIGRKLDFLTQELNREANTTGSKSVNTDIARIVIEIKSELEKVREQIQNIE